MILIFWMLSFKPTFSLSSFIFIKRLFCSSLLSAIRVVSSAYVRLLVFLPAILIPDCASSSPAFLMYSAYKLNKQGDNIKPWYAEVDVFLELSWFFNDPIMFTIWSLVPLPFLNPTWTSGNSWLMYCWSLPWRILSIILLACEMSAIVQ